jgi:hypothetical protein
MKMQGRSLWMTRSLIAVVLLGALGIWQVQAAEISTVGTTVSPTSMEITADPGQVIKRTIKVSNSSDGELSYLASVADFAVQGSEGSVTLNDNPQENSTSKWFKLETTSFKLGRKQTREISYTINVPRNAEPGGHFAALLFQPLLPNQDIDGSGAQFKQRVGSLVLIRISGQVIEKASAVSLTPKTFVGSWNEVLASDGKTKVLVAKDEKLAEEKYKRFFFNGPIAFDLLIKNEGNVHLKPAGTVTITNMFGQKEAELAIEPQNVFPGGQRRTTVIWPNKMPWGLFYKAKLAAIYGNQNQTLATETWFFAFPLWVLILILIILILVIIARKRLKRVMRILIKGN